MTFRILLITSLLALAWGKPLRRDMQLHEARSSAPAGFSLAGAALPDTILNLPLALVRGDDVGLIEALYDVSTPFSLNYGQHLTKEEVEAFVVPKAETVSVQVVNAWLDVPVGQANGLLGTEFSVFIHTVTGQQTVRTLSYSIHTDLVGHLDVVHPTITFPDPYERSPVVNYATSSKRSHSLSLYNIPTTPATSSSIQLAVTGYVYEYPHRDDLSTFLQDLRPDINSNTSYTVVSVNNGTDPQNSSATVEGFLDIQYTVGLATDVPVAFGTVGGEVLDGDDFANVLIDTASYMLNLSSPPQVMTTSYGLNEDVISTSLAYNLCNMLAQLGARGMSILYSSGDGGVSGNQWDETCTTFKPTFPSGCPYITSVGGTINIPETAVNFSGGGFSDNWARPAYQDSAVANYISYLGGANDGLYNASGRAYPDVSAYGSSFEVIVQGEVIGVSGTSCSTPTFASVVALLNDQLLAAGKPALGWLNPFLYSTGASAMNDVTEGNNYACSNFTTGFNATTGWDPVTGLGTPDFAKLKAAVGL
ncbi:peptidase S8/S53 domain-containing protein [Fomitopsis serialis]|uniref:peptidase S8/S53 domain-containing protein n=1 Tax=Fomitopsis serialis TaxID=139415 RepID=UPI002008D37B|nr:peptidase S8/S53 domain-containing protein [Neoantrodia serialis]KAH9913289.1 peptidase S8/S53 domain-containing protein [Neoantrodia serialis]